jgi:hypothetical protein
MSFRAEPPRGGIFSEGSNNANTPIVVRSLCIVCLASCCLSACRTAPSLPSVDLAEPGWRVQQGQAVWRARKDSPEIAGESLLATHPGGRTFLQFTKTPLPFVVAQTTTNAWQIEFVADNRTYSGRGRPPAQLAWLQWARCLAGSVPSSDWKWQRYDGSRWHLENPTTGEMLEGYLLP